MDMKQWKKLLHENKINEIDDYYSIGYYAPLGQHGEIGSYPNFDQAYKKAIAFYNRERKAGNVNNTKGAPEHKDELWMIDVSGNTDEFAIIYMTKQYIDMVWLDNFRDRKAYESWKKVAKKVEQTGKPMKGRY